MYLKKSSFSTISNCPSLTITTLNSPLNWSHSIVANPPPTTESPRHSSSQVYCLPCPSSTHVSLLNKNYHCPTRERHLDLDCSGILRSCSNSGVAEADEPKCWQEEGVFSGPALEENGVIMNAGCLEIVIEGWTS